MTGYDLLKKNRSFPSYFVRLDQDISTPLAGKKQLYTYETMDFWEQIKTTGMSLKCSALYLHQFRITFPHLLVSGDVSKSAAIIGDVYIHPSAKIRSTMKIGTNVSVSANARVGAGARLLNCIVLVDVEIKENAVVRLAGSHYLENGPEYRLKETIMPNLESQFSVDN